MDRLLAEEPFLDPNQLNLLLLMLMLLLMLLTLSRLFLLVPGTSPSWSAPHRPPRLCMR